MSFNDAVLVTSWNQDSEQRRSWQGEIIDITSPANDLENQLEDKSKDITKNHWINNDDRPNCRNRQCLKKFSLIDRPHHCRRCGEVFCNTCVQYQRKLNNLANPDPNGKPYKVCQPCFEEGRDNQVTCRRLTQEFRLLKIRGSASRMREHHGNTKATASWRDKFDLRKETARLIEGFRKSVGNSEVKRTLQEMRTVLTTPDWQKATHWLQENLTEKCSQCREGFSLIQKKRNCKVCGMALCKTCCHRELLVYVPDDLDPMTSQQPQIAIIKIIGSPEVEPEISILLHVCDDCKQQLVDLQVSKVERSQKVSNSCEGPVWKLAEIDKTFAELHSKIDSQMLKYQSIIESLDDGRRQSANGSNTKILAKAQEDLSDFLALYVLRVQVMKKLLPLAVTDTQTVLFKNYLRAKSEFYLDNIYTFRCLKRRLGDSAPPEVLEYIQKVVDKNAIVSAQLYIRQLIFETIHLCDKFNLEESIASLLTPVDKVIETEACQCLKQGGDDWDDHVQNMKQMIRSQMKDHRLIRPSQRALAQHGGKHVAAIMLQRTQEVINQVNVQLAVKSIHRSFPGTKKALDTTHTQVKEMNEIKLMKKK